MLSMTGLNVCVLQASLSTGAEEACHHFERAATLCVSLRRLLRADAPADAFIESRAPMLADVHAQLRELCAQRGVIMCHQWARCLVFLPLVQLEDEAAYEDFMLAFAEDVLAVLAEVRGWGSLHCCRSCRLTCLACERMHMCST